MEERFIENADLMNAAKVKIMAFIEKAGTINELNEAWMVADKIMVTEGKCYKLDSDFSRQETERAASEAKIEIERGRLVIDQNKVENESRRIDIENRRLDADIDKDAKDRIRDEEKSEKEAQKEAEKAAEEKKEKRKQFALHCADRAIEAATSGVATGLLSKAIGYSAWQDAQNVIPNATSKQAVSNATSFSKNVLNKVGSKRK